MIDEIIDNHEKSTWSWNLIALENLSWDLKGYSLRSSVHELLWLDSYYPLTEDQDQYFSYRTSKAEEGLDIKWYSKIYEISLYNYKDKDENIKTLPDYIWWELDLTPYINDIYEKSQTDYSKEFDDREYYVIEEEWKKYILTSMNWNKKSDWTIIINWVSWYLLVK
jgi:hypothetical protein